MQALIANIIREKEKIKTFTNELDALQKSLRTETNVLKELEGVALFEGEELGDGRVYGLHFTAQDADGVCAATR